MVIIPELPWQFKRNINTDNAPHDPYGTIVLQTPQAKRLTGKQIFFIRTSEKTAGFRSGYWSKKIAFTRVAIMS